MSFPFYPSSDIGGSIVGLLKSGHIFIWNSSGNPVCLIQGLRHFLPSDVAKSSKTSVEYNVAPWNNVKNTGKGRSSHAFFYRKKKN